MKQRVRVAAANIASQPGETAGNLERIAQACRLAAERGAELVLFAELSLTGFIPNHPRGDHAAWIREALAGAWRMAEPLEGESVRALAGIAHDTHLYVVSGLIENAGNVLYNTTVLVGPDGLVGAWRKMHIPLFEMPFFNGGPEPGVVTTPLARIGVNICFDALLPESTRLLAVQNVELVLFPFAADPSPGTAEAWAAWACPALQARCRENAVFGVASNYAGRVRFADVEQSFPGGAVIVGPRGEILAQQCEENGLLPWLLVADLDAGLLLAARSDPEYTFRFRRPELYRRLAR